MLERIMKKGFSILEKRRKNTNSVGSHILERLTNKEMVIVLEKQN